MKTFKVYFYDNNLDLVDISTFHNVVNQHLFIQSVACQIVALELFPYVKCTSFIVGDEEMSETNYTEEMNRALNVIINEIDESYISNFYD